jgi:hypothetical protein
VFSLCAFGRIGRPDSLPRILAFAGQICRRLGEVMAKMRYAGGAKESFFEIIFNQRVSLNSR